MEKEKTYLVKPRPGELTELNGYTALAKKTWSGSSEILRTILGIGGEAGEVAEVMKKHLRGDFDWREAKERLFKELGDVLYYVAILSDLIDSDLRSVAEGNIFKLYSRHNRGTLQGDGDDR